MKIVTIGGGDIGRSDTNYETKEIDEEIVRISGKQNPKRISTLLGSFTTILISFPVYLAGFSTCNSISSGIRFFMLFPPKISHNIFIIPHFIKNCTKNITEIKKDCLK